MDWLSSLIWPSTPALTVAHALLVFALVIASGLALGSFRVRGLSLGIAGVLFAGIAFGHFGITVAPEILEFARDFGLVLFVYTIGMQVGPGFVSSLRRRGLRLNLLAASVVLLGVVTTVAIIYLAGVELPASVGLFSGATTNTPSLAAAQQALQAKGASEAVRALPGIGYAVAYPFGVLGLILTVLILRTIFRIDVPAESRAFSSTEAESAPRLATINLEVRNPNLASLPIKDIPLLPSSGIVISRVLSGGRLRVAQPEICLAMGDVLLAVGPPEGLEQLRILVGAKSDKDLSAMPSPITTRRLIVTHKGTLGKSVDELHLVERYGVTVTRVTRADIDLPVSPELRLQFADTVLAVGEREAIDKAATELGNSPKQLNHPMIVPVFVGIALGVIVGSWPLSFPGVPAAVKLGLAGGPLIVAIVLSRIGKIGPLVWYMPTSANFMLREVGIALFLACVGLKAGDRFIATILGGDGLKWLALAALITLVPPLIVGITARLAFKLNFLSICGLLAGSMTDPPALAFVNATTGSEGPAIAYATVYPLAMILRVLAAQLLVLYLG